MVETARNFLEEFPNLIVSTIRVEKKPTPNLKCLHHV